MSSQSGAIDAKSPSSARERKRRAQARIIAPVSGELRAAGTLAILAGALWPVQAAAISWTISGWVADGPDLRDTAIAVAIFILCGLLRALLGHLAGRRLYLAADRTISRERIALIRREARALSDAGSASVASLMVGKLPLLHPWITRYHVAMTRVMVLPLLYLALCFALSWGVGLILLVAGPLIPVFMALVGMAAESASRRQMGEIASMNDMLMDRLSAMLDIRLLGATDRMLADFGIRADTLRAKTMAVLRIAFLSSTLLELFAAIGVAMVAVFVGFSLLGEITFGSWGEPLTLGKGLFVLLLAPEFFQPLRDLAAAWHDRAAGLSVVAELDELDAAERVSFLGAAASTSPLPGPLSIKTEGAVASLPGRGIPLPDLTLAPGGSLALTGPSGAGKSTALAAMTGLLPLKAGRIEVCGRPLDEETADAWRARIAYIPQIPHFPDTTLADWLDPRGSGADPWPALALAKAERIVENLPDGLETRLGETGGGVSGGEARRLMIARAMLTGGDLVFADEPTADLDPETAAKVIEALVNLNRQGLALIVATHDPALAAAMQSELAVQA